MNRNFHRSLPDVFTLLVMRYIKSGISKGDVCVMLMFLFMGLLTMSAKVFRMTVQDGLLADVLLARHAILPNEQVTKP